MVQRLFWGQSSPKETKQPHAATREEAVRQKVREEAFDGTDEQWFVEDVALLETQNPDWNRANRVQDARRWVRKGKEIRIVRGVFGREIADEALRLEQVQGPEYVR